jgi:hypothetical protein
MSIAKKFHKATPRPPAALAICAMGNDRGAGADGATKYITTLRRNANIPITVAVIAVIVRTAITAIVAVINRRQNRKIVRVRTLSVCPLNLRVPLFDTQQLNPTVLSSNSIFFAYTCLMDKGTLEMLMRVVDPARQIGHRMSCMRKCK